jgi:hypothetical protein
MPLAAGKLRVLIATTNGPVEVLLLTEEDAAIGRCVACIGGTTETADIATAYHAFVVRPTGIIEARFGHSCYRLDISARIDAGSSWQLGVLAAHALLAERRLAQENDTADAVLWATGSVRPVDLTVGAVSHVPEKLANSLDRLKQERAGGRQVLVALPAGNAGEVPPEIASELAALGIETLALPHVQPLFDALAMPLRGGPGRASGHDSAAAASAPAAHVATARRRRLIGGAVAASALLAIAATGAVLLGYQGGSTLPSRPQLAEAPTPPAPPSVAPPAPTPVHAALDPDHVPFVTTPERARIRDEYMKAPGYRALATSLLHMAFVAGRATQEDANRAALEACEALGSASSHKAERACELYASGDAVVTQRRQPPMPAEPWFVRNPAIERPFVAAELPFLSASHKERIGKGYGPSTRSKAFVVSVNGRWEASVAQSSVDDAIRRSLERCGYMAATACMVIAVDDKFVIPIPTLAKAVGFYRPDALFGVQAETRKDIARRLADAPNGWNAVAVGAAGNAGIAVKADSERSAFDGAMKDCAQHDRDCRVVVLGPFLVEADHGQNQVQAKNQAPSQNGEQQTAPSPPPAPAPTAPPAATPDRNPAPPQKHDPIPTQTAEQNAPPTPRPPPASAAPPATTADQPPHQTAEQKTPPAPQPPPTPATPSVAPPDQPPHQTAKQNALPASPPATAPSPPTRATLVPDRVPFVSARDRARIRDEYMKAPDHKALAITLQQVAFVTGQPTQEAADRAAMEACTRLDAHNCDLYASGNTVVTRRGLPPVPAEPWLVRNPMVERPFVAAQLPMGGSDAAINKQVGANYQRASRSKAFAIAPNGNWYYTSAHASPDEAMRISLERCGYLNASACMIVAVDDTFVVPMPTLAKVVGVFRPEAPLGVRPDARDEVARRLAEAPNAWNAVAVGADGHAGIAVGAATEHSALDGARADCAKHDRNCRVVVLGPFLVEMADEGQNQVEARRQPLPQHDPPAQAQNHNRTQAQNEEHNVSPAPGHGSPPAAAPVPAAPMPAAPMHAALNPDLVPFITGQERARIRDEYMRAPGYKALATNLLSMAFVTGQPSQEAADRAAMEACKNLHHGPSTRDHVCDLYASGNVVVTRRGPPPMPAQPWLVRNPAVEQPFVVALIPRVAHKDAAARRYQHMAYPKAVVVSQTDLVSFSTSPSGSEDAVRRSLERCGFLTASACLVVAIDDTFVVPIPTLATVTGLYGPEALPAMRPQAREEVARRLAGAPNAWNAVAVGTNGNVGIATDAGSERSAVGGALADCARRDRDCRIRVLGPFLVEMTDSGRTQPPPPAPVPSPPLVQVQKPNPMQSAPATPRLASAPTPAAPPRGALVPDRVPFISDKDRARIRDEYMRARNYKALATSLVHIAFVTGQRSQEAADRAALEACRNLNRGARPRYHVCDLYASGNSVVTQRATPSMPAQPWVVRNPAAQQPFVAAQTPLVLRKDLLARDYPSEVSPKALMLAPTGHWSFMRARSHDEAMRRGLEICSFLTSTTCMVVAIDDTFVVPIPTLVNVIGFYRPEALFALQPQARAEVARRLAGAPSGWNAVAVGAGGHVGIVVGASSERSALDGAFTDCARHDSNCRILVLGPFLVELAPGAPAPAPVQRPAQALPPHAPNYEYRATRRSEYEK